MGVLGRGLFWQDGIIRGTCSGEGVAEHVLWLTASPQGIPRQHEHWHCNHWVDGVGSRRYQRSDAFEHYGVLC